MSKWGELGFSLQLYSLNSFFFFFGRCTLLTVPGVERLMLFLQLIRWLILLNECELVFFFCVCVCFTLLIRDDCRLIPTLSELSPVWLQNVLTVRMQLEPRASCLDLRHIVSSCRQSALLAFSCTFHHTWQLQR